MSAREFFNNNPAVVTGGAVLVLVLCLTAISCSLFGWGSGSKGGNVKIVYYDLTTDTLQLVAAQDRPGSPLADNANAYLCYVMACGECDPKAIKDGATLADIEAAGMYVAYLQTLPDANDMSRELMLEGQVDIYDMHNGEWFSMNSEFGQQIANESRLCPDGSSARACQP